MNFVLQTFNGEIRDVEIFNMVQILNTYSKYDGHTYKLSDKSDIEGLADYIPIGTLEYVGSHLKKYHGIGLENPIEIPKTMRGKDYVGRYYKILKREDIPDRGFSFIKDVSRLKSYCGLMAISDYTRKHLEGTVYQISEYVEFISEYRVFVLRGVIQAIQHYKEDVKVFPDIDIIEQIITDYTAIEGSSKAFTVDVGIDKQGRTLLIEIHTFNSCGTYGFDDKALIRMYELGYKYIVNSNKELELDGV